jgi:hypothetical protein
MACMRGESSHAISYNLQRDSPLDTSLLLVSSRLPCYHFQFDKTAATRNKTTHEIMLT